MNQSPHKTDFINYLALAVLVLTVILCFTGCSSLFPGPNAKPAERLAVQPLLDRIVPSDFEGDGEFAERGQYLVLEVKVNGLKRRQNGAWTWKAMEYRRSVTIPYFTGLTYQQSAWIKLGTPTTAP